MTIRAQIELTHDDPDRLAADCKAVAKLLEERNRSFEAGARGKPPRKDRPHLQAVEHS